MSVIQLLCRCWLVSGVPGMSERGWGEVAVGTVGRLTL